MKVLLAFATNSSGTDLASQLVASILVEKGFEVDHKNIREVSHESIKDYDFIIFASPSWRTRKGDGYPHEFFLDFMDTTEGDIFTGKDFAVFGLGDTAYTHFCGAVDHLEAFIMEHGGKVSVPSLRIDGFYFNQDENEAKLSAWAEDLSQKLLQTSH